MRRDITQAWRIGNFAQGKLKDLDHYLSPLADPERRRSDGARRVLELFRHIAKKQEGANDGARLPKTGDSLE